MNDKIHITFVYPDNSEHTFEAEVGQSVLQIAHKNGVPLEGACEGSLACSTCHVIVDKSCYCNSMCKKSMAEEDMLDLAYGLQSTSRLGCQIILEKNMDGAKFFIPKESRNFHG